MKNHILGTLYGMAIGDAMGMPPELWSRKRCLEYYGKITDFLDGCPENIISYQYKPGIDYFRQPNRNRFYSE